MVKSIRAVTAARDNRDFYILARTDTRAPHRLDEAIPMNPATRPPLPSTSRLSLIEPKSAAPIFISMKSKPNPDDTEERVETWRLPYAATLGSSVRAAGIFLEVRARLPLAARKFLTIASRSLSLRMAVSAQKEFRAASAIVSKVLSGLDSLPVIPREIEDILSISTTERRRWLKDGRLPSAGTRSVKLRGRAKKVTFHVFDPRLVEDVLDRDLIATWREEDAEAAAENRRRRAWKAKLTRSEKTRDQGQGESNDADDTSRPNLRGWEEFERNGPVR
jgi:hypothetical protein